MNIKLVTSTNFTGITGRSRIKRETTENCHFVTVTKRKITEYFPFSDESDEQIAVAAKKAYKFREDLSDAAYGVIKQFIEELEIKQRLPITENNWKFLKLLKIK